MESCGTGSAQCGALGLTVDGGGECSCVFRVSLCILFQQAAVFFLHLVFLSEEIVHK